MASERIEPGRGQESAWDFPVRPTIETTNRHVVVKFGGVAIADTRQAFRLLRRTHPPVYFIPSHHVRLELLTLSKLKSEREYLGEASFYDLSLDGRTARNVALVYTNPNPGYTAIRGHLTFMADRVDEALVDGERAVAQPNFPYGGWITKDVVGPFKGEPGSWDW